MQNVKFSIIVPVYNVEDCLERCVKSLVSQKDAEILLVDDGSTDRSGIMCEEYAKQYAQIKTIHQANGGLSSARNTGIRQAAGDYLLFVDSDDYIETGTCEALENAVSRFGQVDLIAFNGQEECGTKLTSVRQVFIEEEKKFEGHAYMLSKLQNRNLSVESWLYAYRRNFLESWDFQFREGIYHEDVEASYRIFLKAESVLEIPQLVYHYVVRENSISTKKNKEKNIRDLFQTLKEHDALAEQQEPELCRWMKNGILESYLNMIQTAKMYQSAYRPFLEKSFLLGKAATRWNRMRVCLCILNIRLYCCVNDWYKGRRSA